MGVVDLSRVLLELVLVLLGAGLVLELEDALCRPKKDFATAEGDEDWPRWGASCDSRFDGDLEAELGSDEDDFERAEEKSGIDGCVCGWVGVSVSKRVCGPP